MTDADLIDAYDADQSFRNLQPTTRAVRRRYLTKFANEVGFAEATEQKIITWLARPSLSAKSRAMWLSNLRAFFGWATHNKLLPENPAKDITAPRLHARSPRPMPKDDMHRALELADRRMYAWVMLGALQGLRCMEICGLTREDVRDETMTLRIIGKGSKERFLPLHPDVLNALNDFGMPEEGRLWGEETPESVSRKINRFLHGKVGTHFTAHTLRHAFGSMAYQASSDLRIVQEMMGHASPQTTAGYAAPDITKAAALVSGLSI